jgi:hypothetical protein
MEDRHGDWKMKSLLTSEIRIKYDEAMESGDTRRAPALKELLEKLEETSETESSFTLAWGEFMATDDEGAKEAALDRALRDYLPRTDRASEPQHFLSDLANYYRLAGGRSRSPSAW